MIITRDKTITNITSIIKPEKTEGAFKMDNPEKTEGAFKMDNPEKLATLGTQDEDKQNKNYNTICVCFLWIVHLDCPFCFLWIVHLDCPFGFLWIAHLECPFGFLWIAHLECRSAIFFLN
jgi:hypothetical protein